MAEITNENPTYVFKNVPDSRDLYVPLNWSFPATLLLSIKYSSILPHHTLLYSLVIHKWDHHNMSLEQLVGNLRLWYSTSLYNYSHHNNVPRETKEYYDYKTI